MKKERAGLTAVGEIPHFQFSAFRDSQAAGAVALGLWSAGHRTELPARIQAWQGLPGHRIALTVAAASSHYRGEGMAVDEAAIYACDVELNGLKHEPGCSLF